jgi:hypothetical protein
LILPILQARQSAQLFRDFLFKAMDVMDTVRDPDKYAAKILEYADTRDAPVVALLRRIEQVREKGERGGDRAGIGIDEAIIFLDTHASHGRGIGMQMPSCKS